MRGLKPQPDKNKDKMTQKLRSRNLEVAPYLVTLYISTVHSRVKFYDNLEKITCFKPDFCFSI